MSVGHGTSSKSKISNEQIEREINQTGSESFRVTKLRQEGGMRPRTYYTIGGCSSPGWDIPNNDIDSVSHAILERVFFVKDGRGGFTRAPKPWQHESVVNSENPEIEAKLKVQDRLSGFNSKMLEQSNVHGKVSPISDEEFL